MDILVGAVVCSAYPASQTMKPFLSQSSAQSQCCAEQLSGSPHSVLQTSEVPFVCPGKNRLLCKVVLREHKLYAYHVDSILIIGTTFCHVED